jgi:hypothetical protein
MHPITTIKPGETVTVELLATAQRTLGSGERVVGIRGAVEAVDALAVRLTAACRFLDDWERDAWPNGEPDEETYVVPWSSVATIWPSAAESTDAEAAGTDR